MITVIKYEPNEHFDIIKSWADERKIELNECFLSQNGFLAVDLDDYLVVTPKMVIFVYHILGVPIIQLDHLLSKPNMSIFESRKYWDALWKVVSDYISILQTNTNSKFLVKAVLSKRLNNEIKRSGFIVDENPISIARAIV